MWRRRSFRALAAGRSEAWRIGQSGSKSKKDEEQEQEGHREVITESFYTHRRVCTQKRLHREAFTKEILHTRAFTHRRCCTQTLLHKEVFTQRALTHRRVYRQKLLHNEVFTQRAFTHGSFPTQKFLHREIFTQRSFYTQARLRTEVVHKEIFTQRNFHMQKLLHREAFTQRSFYTQKLLHTEAFTQRSLYTEALLHEVESWNWQQFFSKNPSQELSGTSPPDSPLAPRKNRSSMIPWKCSKKLKECISEAAGPHSIATLRWHRGPSNPAEPTALKSGDAVCMYQCAIALRTPAADPPKSFTLLVFSRFWGSGAGKKDARIIRCFWKSILNRFWIIVWRFLLRPGSKNIVKYSVLFYPFRI